MTEKQTANRNPKVKNNYDLALLLPLPPPSPVPFPLRVPMCLFLLAFWTCFFLFFFAWCSPSSILFCCVLSFLLLPILFFGFCFSCCCCCCCCFCVTLACSWCFLVICSLFSVSHNKSLGAYHKCLLGDCRGVGLFFPPLGLGQRRKKKILPPAVSYTCGMNFFSSSLFLTVRSNGFQKNGIAILLFLFDLFVPKTAEHFGFLRIRKKITITGVLGIPALPPVAPRCRRNEISGCSWIPNLKYSHIASRCFPYEKTTKKQNLHASRYSRVASRCLLYT